MKLPQSYRDTTIFGVPIFILAVTGCLWSQIGGGGSIQGTITDPTGAVIPGVPVTATNVATGVVTARQSTTAGVYVLSPLPAGEYTVTVSAQGFQTAIQEHVIVDALGVVGLNMTLKVGSAAERVTVSDTPPQLNTDDATLGQTVRNEVYTSLPLAMNGQGPRDPTFFVNLVPGVQAPGNQISGTTFASFNGGQYFMNQIYLEGLPLQSVITQGESRNVSYGISVEAIDQFQVEISSVPAMYQGQGVENFVLKSGTNRLHGSAYEYLRNTVLDARGFFNATRPVERQNQFGVTVGGPIKRDKIFFFGSYDGYRFTQGLTASLQSIPTLGARTGNFSGFPVPIYDPATTNCSNGPCTRQAFPGNIIPADRFSAVAKSLQSYLPGPINSSLQNNYLPSIPITLRTDTTTEKVDINFTENNRAFVLFSRGKYNAPLQPITDGYAGPLPYTNTRVVIEVPTTAQIKDTYVIKPNLLNQLSYGLTRIWIPLESATKSGDYVTKAGLKGLPPGQATWSFPQISFVGPNSPLAWGGGRTQSNTDAINSFTLQDNLQWIHGRHSVTTGVELQWNQDNFEGFAGGSGQTSFGFSNTQTAGFSPTGTLLTTTGNAYASYLLGLVNNGSTSETAVTRTGARYRSYSGYVQDDFKVNSRLTLNLGVRYDIMTPYRDVADRWSFLNPDLPNAAADNFRGALQFAGNGPNSCKCSSPINTHYNSWGPRLGLAYRLGDKTVIRAGYAVMYTHMGGVGGRAGAHNGPGTLGFAANPSFITLDGGISPAFNWDGGFPSYQRPPFFNSTLNTGFTTATPSGGAIGYADFQNGALPPRIQNFNIGIQRALASNLTLGLVYSGSVSHHLAQASAGGRSIFTNQINPKYLALGNLLRSPANAANVAAARANFPEVGLPFPSFNGTIGQMLRPFPQYNAVNDTFSMIGNATYNSFQATLAKRMSAGLIANFAYTFAKEIDDIANGRTGYNNRLEKAVGSVDQRHVMSLTFVYRLPFGKGHPMGDGNPVVRALVSDWQLSGIITASSGLPLGPLAANCNAPMTGACYGSYNRSYNGPVRINGNYGDGNVLGANSTAYIDKNAFTDPAAFAFGDLPRTLPFNLRNTFNSNQDLSVRREFGIREWARLAIQGDFFNITNRVQFTGIGTNINSANFGMVSAQANSPRKVQLAARLTF